MPNAGTKLLTLPIIALLAFVVCTYFPLIYRYFPILGTIKAVLIAGIVMLIGYLLTKDNYVYNNAYKDPLFLALTGFLSALILSLLMSLDRGKTLDWIIVNIKYFIVTAVMIKIVDNGKKLDVLLGVFTACGVGMALGSIINYLTGQTSIHGGYTSGVAISTGIFGDPNDLALLFNTTLPFALFFLVKAKKKLLPLVGISIIITAIILTFSRGGFVGLCAVGFGFSIFYARKRKKYFAFLFMLVFLFWCFAPVEYSERIATIFAWEVDQETGETGTRMDAWRIVMEEGFKHPVLGVGAGCSIYIAGSSAMSDWHLVHNSFIQVFSESGLLGLFFYLLLFYLPYKQYRAAVRCIHRDEDLHLVRFSMIIVSFLSYGISVVFLPQAYSPILYTLAGIAIIQAQLISLKPAKALQDNGSRPVLVNLL